MAAEQILSNHNFPFEKVSICWTIQIPDIILKINIFDPLKLAKECWLNTWENDDWMFLFLLCTEPPNIAMQRNQWKNKKTQISTNDTQDLSCKRDTACTTSTRSNTSLFHHYHHHYHDYHHNPQQDLSCKRDSTASTTSNNSRRSSGAISRRCL